MKVVNSSTPVAISDKLEWLNHRYWKFGDEEYFDDDLMDLFAVDNGQKSIKGKALKTVKNGAGGRTRTGTGFRPKHFKCHMSTIPSRPHKADVALS